MRLRLLLPMLAALAALCGLATAAAAQTAAPAASAAETGPRFDILAFVVEGDTVLGTAAIERAVYPFLGPGRSVADAEAARKALEVAYQQAGYLSVSVQLPPQQVDAGGDVRLLVRAATIDRLRVTGAQYTLPSSVAAAVPSLAPGTVPDFNAMQDDLSRLAAASAHRDVTPLLAAGRAPDTLDVELKLQDNLPLSASIELNSKQSLNTRAGRLEAGLQYDNLFQRGHGVGLNWFVAPGRSSDANVLSLLYHLPLGGDGDRLFASLLHSASNTPTPLGGASVARGDTWRLRWRDALPSSATARQAMTWGLTLRNLQDSSVDIAGISSTPPALRYPVFSVGYELDLSHWGAVRGRQSRLSAELNFALRGLARRQVDCLGTVKDQFACKRDGARPDFQVLALNLSHAEPVGDWTLSARLQGQLSDGPLVSPEQIVFGGQDSVRGYLDGEQAGDIGVALRLELVAPPWRPTAGPFEGLDLRAHLFHDIARLQRLEPLPGEIRHMALASVGFGIGLGHRSGLQATLGWAWLLEPTEQVVGSGQRLPISGSGSTRRQRWDLSLRQSF